MLARKTKHFKTIYIQLDNTSINKCYALLVGVAVLLLLGITDAVKIAYLVVGHSHTDIDRIIGLVSSYLKKKDIFTYEDFMRYAKVSILNVN